MGNDVVQFTGDTHPFFGDGELGAAVLFDLHAPGPVEQQARPKEMTNNGQNRAAVTRNTPKLSSRKAAPSSRKKVPTATREVRY